MSLTDVKTDFNVFWRRANTSYQPFYQRAQTALLAYAGKSWTNEEVHLLAQQSREAKEFNIIRPKVNVFSGYARDNMKSTIVTSRTDEGVKTADQLTDMLLYIYDKGSGYQHLLNSFDDCLKVGISLIGIWMDYSKDAVFGDIKFFRRAFNSFVIDPDWTEFDLTDASEVAFRDFVTREDAKVMLPFVDPKAIDEVPAYNRDDKYQLLRTGSWYRNNPNLISFDSYYRMVNRRTPRIVDTEGGFSWELTKREIELGDEEIKTRLMEKSQIEGREYKLEYFNKRVAELNILLSGEPVYQGPDPTGLDEYPFACNYCYWEPQLADFGLKFQGIATALVDNQRSFNKRMIRKEDMMDSVVNTGWIYKTNKFPSLVEGLMQTGNGILIPANQDADLDRDIKPIAQGAVQPGWQEDIEYNEKLSYLLAGINESVAGTDEGSAAQLSGRLAMVRTANGLRANRGVFDNFERTQMLIGSKVLKCAQANWSPRSSDEVPIKVIRIINEEPTEDFFNEDFDKYEITIKQGVMTQNQKDALYFELVNLAQLGYDIDLQLLLKNLPITGLSDVLEAVEAKEQQKQEAQKMQMQQQARDAALQQSITDQNIALAQERRARVLSDIGLARERVTESIDNRADAELKRAKTMAEIDKIGTDKLEVLVNLVRMLQQDSEQSEERAIQSDIQKEQLLMQQGIQATKALEALNQPQEQEQPQPIGG